MCAGLVLFFANLVQVRDETMRYARGVAADYAALESRYLAVFRALTIPVRQKIAEDPSFEEMNAWLQTQESDFRAAVGAQVYDGFALTYKGGYAHSWDYGDYSDYVPATRAWYQAAQRAGGAATMVAPYVTYVGSQFPDSDQYIEASVAQRYSAEISFDLDLKIGEINQLFPARSLDYSGATGLLFDRDGYLLSTTDDALYCHNINRADAALDAGLSALLVQVQQRGGDYFAFTRAAGCAQMLCAVQDAAGNTYCVLIPVWSIFARNLMPSAAIMLLLVLLEIGIYFSGRRAMAGMAARDRLITAITQAAFQRQVLVDLTTMACTPDADSCALLPPGGDYRQLFMRLRSMVVGEAARREFTGLLSPEQLRRAEGEALVTRRFLFDLPQAEGKTHRVAVAVSRFVTRLDGQLQASLMGRDVTEEERDRRQIMESIASHYTAVVVGSTDDSRLEVIKTDRQFSFLAAPGDDLAGAQARYAGTFLTPASAQEYLQAFAPGTIRTRLARENGYSITVEGRDGHWQTCRIVRSVGYDKDHRYVFFAENADEQMRRQDILAEALARANEAARAKDDFLSRMSHDIRTPMNGIIGMTRMARGMPCSAEVRSCLDKIDTSSQFLLGLVNEVLDMSKVDSDRVELHPQPYPVEEFLRYLDSVIRPQCEEKGLALVTDVQIDSAWVPLLDKVRTNQIALNLLSNAIKFTPAGGTVRLGLSTSPADGDRLTVGLTVADTGVGISEEFQKTMFEPFAQENRSDVAENRGTGLGLAIVQRLVTLMGGSIAVDSRPGAGTRFVLSWPAPRVPAKTPAQAAPAAAPERSARLAGARVLLAEDHPLNQEIAAALLREKKMEVDIAADGRQALERFAASPAGYYAVVLMDIRMPVMDGYAALRAIRALDRPDAKTIPVLAMTADAFADDVARCRAAGMDGHIAKPIEPELLFAALADVLVSAPPDSA